MTELLPCPFCGGEAELMNYYDFYKVNCKNESCHAHITDNSPFVQHAEGKWFPSVGTAGEAWNTRAERTCAQCAKDMGAYADSLCDPLKERVNELLRCLENDWRISASWDGLRKFWCIELTEDGVRLRDAEMDSRAERTCECVVEYAKSPLDGKTIVLHRCSSCHELMRPHMNYCPNCGARVEVGE